MFTKIIKTFAATGVAERISATELKCSKVVIQALRANSNACQIAPGTFVTGQGYELPAPAAGTKLPERIIEPIPGQVEGVDLNAWYCMGTQNEGLYVEYETY